MTGFNAQITSGLKSCKVLTSASRPTSRAARALHNWNSIYSQPADGIRAPWPDAKLKASFQSGSNPQYYFEACVNDTTLALVAFMDGSVLIGRVDYQRASANSQYGSGILQTDRMISFAPYVFGLSKARTVGAPRLRVVNPGRAQHDARLKADWPAGDLYGDDSSSYVLKSKWEYGADWQANHVQRFIKDDLFQLAFLTGDLPILENPQGTSGGRRIVNNTGEIPVLDAPQATANPKSAIWPAFLPHSRATESDVAQVSEWAQTIVDQITLVSGRDTGDICAIVLAPYPHEGNDQPPEIYLTYKTGTMRMVAEPKHDLHNQFCDLSKITHFPLKSNPTGIAFGAGSRNSQTLQRTRLGSAKGNAEPSGHRKLQLERLFGK
jgi:hypothetical protein